MIIKQFVFKKKKIETEEKMYKDNNSLEWMRVLYLYEKHALLRIFICKKKRFIKTHTPQKKKEEITYKI